jgi:hypothetical protein
MSDNECRRNERISKSPFPTTNVLTFRKRSTMAVQTIGWLK